MAWFEHTVKTGKTCNGCDYELRRRTNDAVEAGAAPYILYVSNEFYCTCESRKEADEEIKTL